VWVSDPTWGNHPSVFKAAGLKVREYPYYDAVTQSLRGDEMLAALAEVPAGDVVLLHACCHNPSGVDLEAPHWQAVAELAERQGFLCFVDMAYQGFSTDLDSDAFGPRLLAQRLPELLLATSCSKNFGLYRERIGAVSVIGHSAAQTQATFSQLLSAIRNVYSMPPAHGAIVVREILDDAELRAQWLQELADMRGRINHYRSAMVQALRDAGVERDFGFIERQRGMFSFLGITAEQVERLKTEHAIYMVGSSRMNIAGLSASNLAYFAAALKAVL
jgi:aspartate aminotransferase